MFVLSVGFLMAQGVFTYQAVVVDQNGNLVANQTVKADVTIKYGNPEKEVTQTLEGIQTSRNGLALLPIGGTPAFQSIDWKTAKIKVDFTVTSDDVTVTPGQLEQVPAVPVALQTKADLTTPMIVEYIKNADMDDVRAILAAMDHGTPTLKDTLLATAVDTAKANYELAKQVFLHYVSHATAEDIDTLYKSLMTNPELVNVIDTVLAHFVKTYKEDVYDVLREYALHLDGTDVQNVWDTIPGNVKDYIVTQIISYLTTDDTNGTAKSQIIIPVIKNYAQTMTNTELKNLIEALENNAEAYPEMLKQFNKWMDEYFNTHYTGGGNVASTVATTIESNYYVCSDTVDLCQLQEDLEELTEDACFEVDTAESHLDPDYNYAFKFTKNQESYLYIGTVKYTGTEEFTPSLAEVRIPRQGQDDYVIPLSPNETYIFLDANNNISVKLPFSLFQAYEQEYDLTVFSINLIIESDCYPDEHELIILGLYLAN